MYRFILFLFIIPNLCLGQTDKTFFWEISGNGLKNPSYLFGTMHVECKEDIIITQSVKNAIQNSQVIFLEINYSEPVNTYKSMLNSFNYKGKNIETYFTKSEIRKLDKLIQKKTKERLYNYQYLKPEYFYHFIYNLSLPCKIKSYEEELSQIARNRNLKFASLETFEEHNKALIYDEQIYIKEIKSFLNHPKFNVFKRDFIETKKQYNAKDPQKLYDDMLENGEEDNDTKKLLSNRNLAWIPTMDLAMKKNRCFFAFGAGHLSGDKGVISLLKKAGYTIKPIFY